jgi:6-phosphogluconolactonase
MDIRVEENPAAVVAEMLAEAGDRGSQLVLTGGSTPKLAYEMASRADVDWSRSTVWFSDERCVHPEHGLSNFRMANDAFFGRINRVQRPLVMRMEGELGPDAGAGNYEAAVRERMGSDPRWNLLLLGMGPDGHIASLFPGKPEVEERSRMAVGVPLAGMEPQVPRITLTMPALAAAREAILLITGESKAATVARAFGPDADRSLPAALIELRYGTLTVLLDEAAASQL